MCPGPGKIQWTLADVKTVALNMKRGMPVAVTQALTEGWEGGAIIQLEDTISRPTAADLVVNHVFLRPFARQCPAKVPSAFFAADVFLFLDQCFCDRLLIPQQQGDTKRTLAAEEGKKVKSLIGYLRYLWRSSNIANNTVFSSNFLTGSYPGMGCKVQISFLF